MGHVILLGDSIFDNERYVPDRPPVIEQVRHSLPTGWQASLLAVDGHVTEDGRHLCVSGGLGCSIAPIRFGSPPEIMVVDLG